MRQQVAPTGRSIKIITAFILMLTLVMLIAATYESALVWAVVALIIIVFSCYLYAPVAYIIENKQLIVIRRINRKIFGPVVKCSSISDDKPSFGIRIWGNGGLFAGTGIFWNRKYGIFRAYVTTGNRDYLVLVETPSDKVIITPEDPEQFIVNY